MAQTLSPVAILSPPAATFRLPLAEPKPTPLINPWFIAITVTLATFMELLDTAIANVALPHIAGGLAVSADESTWVLTSYLVSNAVVLPLSAWLSRLFGRKRYYMICVTLFTDQLAPLWIRPQPRHADFLPRAAGNRRRWPRSCRAGNPRRHISRRKTRRCVRALQHGDRHRARDRPAARRLDHRSLELALGLFHQHSHRHRFADPHEPVALRSARIHARSRSRAQEPAK